MRNSEVYRIATNPSYSIATGILLGTGVGNAAYNNIVRDIPGPGISSGNGASGSKIYNNTVVRNQYGITTGNTSGTIIRNNIAVSNSAAPYYDWGNTSNLTASNNLCNVTNTVCSAVGSPSFVDANQNNFRLQTGSAAIDTGMTLSDMPARDMLGTQRPQGSAWDLGSYESGAVSTTPPPAPPENVRIIR